MISICSGCLSAMVSGSLLFLWGSNSFAVHPDLHGACVVIHARLLWVELSVRGPRFYGCGQFSELGLLVDKVIVKLYLAHQCAAVRQQVLVVLEVVEVAKGGLFGFLLEQLLVLEARRLLNDVHELGGAV